MFAFIAAIIITMPLLFYVLLYIWFHKWTNNKRKAFRGAVHLTAPVIVVAVYLLLNNLVDSGFGGWVIVALLILLGVSLIIQYRTTEEIRLGKTFKGLLRLTFLVFSFAYLFLISYGLMRVILSS
ncbi:DUF3397 domain-containing protein [Salimicrobium flavidum]|nr:DUF3397 domain-containing protein [Salimicrobium flavidum]